MVTEPTREAEQDSPPSDFTIHDSTPPEQLEVEAEQDAQLEQPEAAQVAEVDGEQVPLGRDTEVQPSVQPEPVQQQSQPVQQEQPRVYSQDEVAKMQSAWAKQLNEERKRANEQAEAKAIEDRVASDLNEQERNLVARVGAQQARQMVRTPENEQAVRANVARDMELLRMQNYVRESEAQREQQAAITVAQQLATQHGLSPEDQQVLLAAQTPQAMQAMAQRLGQMTQQMRSRVPPETPQTTLENGISSGSGPEDSYARLQRLRGVPASKWSDADYEWMKNASL